MENPQTMPWAVKSNISYNDWIPTHIPILMHFDRLNNFRFIAFGPFM